MKKGKFEKFVMDVKLNLGVSHDSALAAIGRGCLKAAEQKEKENIELGADEFGRLGDVHYYNAASKSDYDDMLKRLDPVIDNMDLSDGAKAGELLRKTLLKIKGENKMKEIREVSIQKVNRGYVVEIGCEIIVFEKSTEMYKAIDLYHSDPEAAKKKYLDSSE